jgi:7-carboxy-7-deazaguanine synthase
MSYLVKEMFYSLQGEGAQVGRPAVFIRFAGCNLWSGREEDRARAVCKNCDTDFVGTDGGGGGEYEQANTLAHHALNLFPLKEEVRPYVICTGGEPLLQLDELLLKELHDHGFEIAIETNGTVLPPPGIDWICVSPKAGSELVLESGNELKLLFPQKGLQPEGLIGLDFQYFFMQPIDGPRLKENMALAVKYCMEHPKWRLSIQMHKVIGIR